MIGGAATVNQTSGTLTGNVSISGTATVSQAAGSTLSGSITDTSTGSSTFAGAITGTGKTVTLNAAGGMLTLSGANTFTGPTTITTGTLILSGTGSLGNTAVTLGNGATLEGTGAANSIGGVITDNSGNINLQASSGINALDASNITGGGTLSIDVGSGGTSDSVNLTGTAALASSAFTVNVNTLAGATAGTQYTFFSAAGGLSASDFSVGMLTGTLAGDTFSFSGSGNAITLTINAAAGYFFTGANSTDFNDPGNLQHGVVGWRATDGASFCLRQCLYRRGIADSSHQHGGHGERHDQLPDLYHRDGLERADQRREHADDQ